MKKMIFVLLILLFVLLVIGFTNADACNPMPETCDGADEDCDGIPDNGFECILGSVDCDASCMLNSGGCSIGNLEFVQTDWSGGKEQFILLAITNNMKNGI